MPEASKPRPQFRNIHVTQIVKYRLPLGGLLSILHRISGLLMFLFLPFVLYLLDNSLTSNYAFEHLKEFVQPVLVKLIIVMLAWAYLHHFFAGIRHLTMDVHIGVDINSSCKSAVGVFLISIPVAALVGLKLFGVF
ncbi:MAG: sdhC [Solimicrobium sp.]|jgi:succinate dehydrogenase / fumarate reductase cytochrome b subunit|nr:sdhC [Solimicrobium sp.]